MAERVNAASYLARLWAGEPPQRSEWPGLANQDVPSAKAMQVMKTSSLNGFLASFSRAAALTVLVGKVGVAPLRVFFFPGAIFIVELKLRRPSSLLFVGSINT
jgi:hypothetical protein